MVAVVMLLVAKVTLKYIVTMETMQMVYKFVQSDAHIMSRNTIIINIMFLIVVSMATIVVDESKGLRSYVYYSVHYCNKLKYILIA